MVDPELRSAALQLQEQLAALSTATEETIALARAVATSLVHPPHPDVPVAEHLVPGWKNIPAVRVYVINAKPGTRRPGILHTHGGGYMFADARVGIPDLQRTAASLDCVVTTVDYRLAPEARFYESIEDNYLALKWMHRNAAEIGLDPDRIAVMGESAGGGHAALLAIAARDRGEVPLVYQMLIYPMLDDRTGSSSSVAEHIGTLIWPARANRLGWRSFLGCEPGESAVPTNAVPARVPDLTGLPPAFIGVGALDLFVNENIDYARRLINAGVQTELLVIPGAFHGFDLAEETSVAMRFRSAKLQALARAFGDGRMAEKRDPQGGYGTSTALAPF